MRIRGSNNDQFRAIVTHAKDAVVMIDDDGRICVWNPAAERLFGFSEREAVGRLAHAILISEDRQLEFLEKFSSFNSDGELVMHPSPLKVKNKEGLDVPVEVGLSVFKLNDKCFALGIIRDISDQVRMQDKLRVFSEHLKSMVDMRTLQLKAANEQLARSERLAAIGELAGMVGHDLRNPLTGIKTAAYYLRRKNVEGLDASGKEMLDLIDRNIDRSNKIINDLLEYSREIHLDLVEISPKSLVKDALSFVILPPGIDMILEVDDNSLVKVDVEKIVRVFVNLIKNSIDAMPKGGILKIYSRYVVDFSEICFSDNGEGISEENLKNLFKPLFTTKAQGMGFGLAICKRIIEAHDGKVSVKSNLDKGTQFCVSLPLVSVKSRN